MLLAVTPAKPSSSATDCAVDGVRDAGERAASRAGSASIMSYAKTKRCASRSNIST